MTEPASRRAIRRDSDRHADRYRQLVELAPDGILVHDGERIVLANAAAVRLAGATHREQFVGQPISTFLHPPYLKAIETQLLGSDDLAPFVAPVRDTFRRLDQSEVEVEVTAIAFLDGDRPSAHLVIKDITERLELQRAASQAEVHLHDAQKMEAVGALAGGVAHEVNNMMSVVLGFGAFLVEDPDLSIERLSDVREIMKAADRASAVTRQLLSFSRRAFHRPQIVDLRAAVHALEPVVRRLLGEDRHLALRSDASPRVRVDPGQFEQVVINLALNARDAMPGGGTLTITTAESELAGGVAAADGVAIPAGRYALLVVHDSGVGMDAATQARIFEPFFTTKPTGHGTGLGLAAAYGIMTQNNGYIALTTAPGLGTAFTLYLPICDDADLNLLARPPVPVGPGADRAAATVLVVDDEVAVRTIVRRSLQRSGFQCLEASDGASALALIARHGPPHLVLTDLVMPGIGGIELARRLRELWPEQPILFMSGYSLDDLRRQGVAGIEGGLIQKPFSPRALASTVAEALARAGPGRGRALEPSSI